MKNPNYNLPQQNGKMEPEFRYSGIVQNENNEANYRASMTNANNNPLINWIPYIIFGVVEIVSIILIACLYQWDTRNHPDYSLSDIKIENLTEFDEVVIKATNDELNIFDGLFRDINIMVFVGFGMFHSLLKRYAWTSITVNMFTIALSFQIGLFTNLLWANAFREKWKTGILNYQTFIKSIFNSCTTLENVMQLCRL